MSRGAARPSISRGASRPGGSFGGGRPSTPSIGGGNRPSGGIGNVGAGNRPNAGQGNLGNRGNANDRINQITGGNNGRQLDRNTINTGDRVNNRPIDRGDINVDVDGGYGGWGGCCYGGWGAAAAGAIVGAAAASSWYGWGAPVGTVVYTIPPECTTTVVNGVSYSQCGSTYYEPQFTGTEVSYVAVSPPSPSPSPESPPARSGVVRR